MIEFITLFLGLVSGMQHVEVSVTEGIAKVEILLDGQEVAALEKEPWRTEIDLGAELKPRRLEAIGRDGQGNEIYRAEQILNVAGTRAMLRIILGKRQADGTRAGRLVWLAADNARPHRVSVTVDGEPLEVKAMRGFQVPFQELDSEEVHLISAQADFEGGLVANATVLIGGAYGDQVTSQLTAVPVTVGEGVALPSLEKMRGWLRKGGEELEIMAIEERAAEIIVVRADDSLESLYGLTRRFRSAQHRSVGGLGAQRALRLLRATPEREQFEGTDRGLDKYPLSEPLSEGHGGVPWVLGNSFFTGANPFDGGDTRAKKRADAQPQRLADAVANAGLTAAASGWLRAVVLVLGPDQPEDASQWSPARVRQYLSTLRVPLYVWSTLSDTQRAAAQDVAQWEPIHDISNSPQFLDAIGDLSRDLDRQRILWVRGVHFLHDISLTGRAQGVQLLE